MNNSERILNILAEQLEIDLQKIDVNTPLANVENMDSMQQVIVINKIENEFEISMDFEDLFEIETVEDLILIVNEKILEK